MDNGALFEREFQVLPGEDGSFIIVTGRIGVDGRHWGFTNLEHMMQFLHRHHGAKRQTTGAILGGTPPNGIRPNGGDPNAPHATRVG